jgi:hypothetical protein
VAAFLLLGCLSQSAAAAVSTPQTESLGQMAFDKNLDLNLALKILERSPADRLQIMSTLGIEVYEVSSNPVTLPSKVPKADTVRFAEFLEEFSSGTYGLYLSPSDHRNQVHRPTLLLQANFGQWTLVHEFLHALFDRARLSSDDLGESALENSLRDTQDQFLDLQSRFNTKPADLRRSDAADEVVKALDLFADTLMESLRRYELEEVAIEIFLRERYAEKVPEGFAANDYLHSVSYLRSRGEAALSKLEPVLSICVDLSQRAPSCARAAALKAEIESQIATASRSR